MREPFELAREVVSLMLTQPENRLDFDELLNQDKILLLDLSNLGPDTRGILGCFFESMLATAQVNSIR